MAELEVGDVFEAHELYFVGGGPLATPPPSFSQSKCLQDIGGVCAGVGGWGGAMHWPLSPIPPLILCSVVYIKVYNILTYAYQVKSYTYTYHIQVEDVTRHS